MKHLVSHILPFFLGCLGIVQAQDFPYIRFTTDNGLPTNYVYGVTEDSEGNIWAYTENGIVKYDGYTFRTFTVKDGLPGNDVTYACTDEQGRVWMEIYKNKPAYIWHDSISTPFPHPALIYNRNGTIELDNNYLHYFFTNTGWISHLTTIPNDLFQFMPEAFEYRYSTSRAGKSNEELASYLEYSLLTPDSAHYYRTNMRYQHRDVWLQINGASVPSQLVWRSPSGQWQKAFVGTLQHGALPNTLKTAIMDERYVLNISSLNEAFLLDLHSGNIRFINLHDLGIHPAMHNAITVMDGHFWISTDDGAASFRFDGSPLETVRLGELCDKQLLHRTSKDSQGNIWVGSLEGGLFFIPYSHTRVRKLHLPQYQVVHFDRLVPWAPGILLGITAQSGVYEIRAGRINELVPPNPKFRLRSACRVAGELWVSGNLEAFRLRDRLGGWRKSPLRLDIHEDIPYFTGDGKNHAVDPQNYPNSALNITAANYGVGSGDVYGIVSTHLMFKYSTKRQQLEYIAGIRDNQCLHFDTTRQVLLLGRWDGIVRWEDYQLCPFLQGNPQIKNVTVLHSTPDYLWIGTEGNGLFCYSYATDSLHQVSSFKYVRNIHPGYQGSLLVAGADGVQVIGSTHSVRHHFNHLDGLPSEDIEDVAQLDSNRLLVATAEGLFEVRLDFPALPPLDVSKLRITAFAVNGVPIDSAAWYKPLSYKQNNISFSFHLQHIASRGQITYQTRLEPLESNWQMQKDRKIQYPGLHPGHYTFYLEATDIYGRTVKQPPFSFTIRPAWWQTAGFKASLWGVFLIGMIGYFAYRREKEKRELQKEKALNKRLAELELSALRAQMNPHFVFNALGAIQYYIQTSDVEAADNYLTMFATLMRKYLESSREQVIPLEQEVQLLEYYTQLEMMRFEGIFQTSIQISRSLRQYNAHLPSMLVQPFVENAINHGLCERRDGLGQLLIYFEGDDNNIKCTIEDNGIGREKSRLRRSKAHRSQAMRIVEEKIETLKLSGIADITVDINDALPDHAEYPGTKVVLRIKNLDNEEH